MPVPDVHKDKVREQDVREDAARADDTVAVIGAGRVGRELARRAAMAGYRVVLEDLIPTSLERATDEIRLYLDTAAAAGHLPQSEADEAFARIECATSIEGAARRARIVMETGPCLLYTSMVQLRIPLSQWEELDALARDYEQDVSTFMVTS